MTLVICQTFISPIRTEVQSRVRRSHGTSRGSTILWVRGNPRNFPASFHFFFILCWDTVAVWTLSFPVCAMKERGVRGLLIPKTCCKTTAAYAVNLVIFSFNGAAELYGLHALSCIGQNLAFSRMALCMLFKIGFYEFR